jgi:hypothetical protein
MFPVASHGAYPPFINFLKTEKNIKDQLLVIHVKRLLGKDLMFFGDKRKLYIKKGGKI